MQFAAAILQGAKLYKITPKLFTNLTGTYSTHNVVIILAQDRPVNMTSDSCYLTAFKSRNKISE
jgi:hypothetical protein